MTQREKRIKLIEDLYGYFPNKEVFTSVEFQTKLNFKSYPNAMRMLKKLILIGLVEAKGNNRNKRYRVLDHVLPIETHLLRWNNDIKQKDCTNERNPSHLKEILTPKVHNNELKINRLEKQLAKAKTENEALKREVTSLKAQNEALDKRLQLIEKPLEAVKEVIKLITC